MPNVYQNPVWPDYFADPFVLRVGAEYFAYGTDEPARRRAHAFTILRSRNLAHWQAAGQALVLEDAKAGAAFWAPEVAAHDGRFFLYYSTAPEGRDELHRIHVATADSPLGPFTPQGAVLPESEGFCIDAHPFRDPADGKWHLFFAKDFFTDRTGTGLAVVALDETMTRAATPPREVLRANHDWQIYERARPLYGQTWAAWHTVEGPCVIAHGGRYFCFYSGGNWQTHDYGVSYAVAPHPLGPWTHAPETGPVVLRQRGDMLGPGHNSCARSPDGRSDYLVYHAWDRARTARRMCIDPLVWTPEGPRCAGPTNTPQPLVGA